MSSISLNQVRINTVQKVRKRSRFLKLLADWYAAQYVLEKHWQKYSAKPASKNVSFRVWSKYGAYLEEHLDQDQ